MMPLPSSILIPAAVAGAVVAAWMFLRLCLLAGNTALRLASWHAAAALRSPAGTGKTRGSLAALEEGRVPLLADSASSTPTAAKGGLASPGKLPSLEARLRAMVARFSLPFDQLAALLVERGAVVAGGAMVAAYMPGQPAEAFSGDFDIFIRQADVEAFTALLAGADYSLVGTAVDYDVAPAAATNAQATDGKAATYAGAFGGDRDIQQVFDFAHAKTSSKVQLIVCVDPQTAPAQFDLSAAATWWDGDQLQTLFPDTTDSWECFRLREDDARAATREAKYVGKGFKIIPCPWTPAAKGV